MTDAGFRRLGSLNHKVAQTSARVAATGKEKLLRLLGFHSWDEKE